MSYPATTGYLYGKIKIKPPTQDTKKNQFQMDGEVKWNAKLLTILEEAIDCFCDLGQWEGFLYQGTKTANHERKLMENCLTYNKDLLSTQRLQIK